MDAAFEFITKMGLPFYCFHDVDVVDYTNDVAENDKRLAALTAYAKENRKPAALNCYGARLIYFHIAGI